MRNRRPLSGLKKANLPYLAAELESILREAPGHVTPAPVRKPRRNMKLEMADAEIRRCEYCGSWHTQVIGTLCAWCSKNPYPFIDDIKETA